MLPSITLYSQYGVEIGFVLKFQSTNYFVIIDEDEYTDKHG